MWFVVVRCGSVWSVNGVSNRGKESGNGVVSRVRGKESGNGVASRVAFG